MLYLCAIFYKGMTEKERNLLYGVVSLILPENILDQFDIVKLEDEDIARNDGTYQPFKHNVHIYLDEQDNRTAEQRLSLKPNGFTEYTSVKDYPVRNRLLTLHIRRRRYLDAGDRSVILSEFPLKADGTSISPEFADFLKGGVRQSSCNLPFCRPQSWYRRRLSWTGVQGSSQRL